MGRLAECSIPPRFMRELRPIVGRSSLEIILEEMRRTLRRRRIIRTPGLRVEESDGGTRLYISKHGGKGQAGEPTEVEFFKLHQMFNDWVYAHTWDGETEGDLVTILKPPRLWCSVMTESKAGEDHDYEYLGGPDSFNVMRQDSYGGKVEKQLVTPFWIEGEILTATKCDPIYDDGTDPIEYILTGSFRQWASKDTIPVMVSM